MTTSPPPPPLPLISPTNSSHTIFRVIHPIIVASGFMDWYAAYVAASLPMAHKDEHMVAKLLEGWSAITWGLGGMVQYERELPRFLASKAAAPSSVLSVITKPNPAKIFQTSTRIYTASFAGLVGLTGHHCYYAGNAMAHDRPDRATAHVAAAANTMSYAFLWQSIFLQKSRVLTPVHLSAIAVMAYVWLSDSERPIKFTTDYAPFAKTESGSLH
ncbi:hypothetical protein SDRG_08906 [Saprolegnia diclina VS20]|uniref:Uncharacterized protein n=1 Tax=Saprolegnia diclina (strain VS20) TaxID=1156394 RepID=T0Q6A9_SAPDV|nr:hypothetical protein SDRG_08906 [Saprolegnia diclina VS20]EQC33389.1 hypothetical protein SDRG_08906 [Saprolegnia diclina VS20]|eukprot:XP_008613029.1 hypothetical protein SDRG_08906 [Saprolegnia diclina VS20]